MNGRRTESFLLALYSWKSTYASVLRFWRSLRRSAARRPASECRGLELRKKKGVRTLGEVLRAVQRGDLLVLAVRSDERKSRTV